VVHGENLRREKEIDGKLLPVRAKGVKTERIATLRISLLCLEKMGNVSYLSWMDTSW
jgi:hypothetical protein